MNTTGSLILLFALGLMVIVDINATGDLFGEASASNDTSILKTATGGGIAIVSILTVLGYLALLIGAMIAIKAFS